MNRTRHATAVAISVVLAVIPCGCRRQAASDDTASRDGSPSAQQPAPALAHSPAKVVRLLQTYNRQRNFEAIAPLLVQEQRTATVALLKAVDAVLDANAEMQAVARQKYGEDSSGLWDLASMRNNLGPFSDRLTLFSQHFKGDKAFVTMQEGDHIPLVHGRFTFDGNAWKYRPDATPANIVPELHKLAETLQGISVAIRNGASFEFYDNAFVERVLPQIKRVASAQDNLPEAIAAGDSVD